MEDASVTHKLGVSEKIFNVIFFLSFIFHKQYKFPQQQFVQKNKNKDDELLMAFGVTLDYKKKIRGLSWSWTFGSWIYMPQYDWNIVENSIKHHKTK